MTRAWELYELGRQYNQSLTPNQYDLVKTNTEFFIGNQWLRLPNTPAMRALPKPVFNILKRVASLFVASLTSSATTMRFEPLAYYDGANAADPDHDAAEFANAAVETLLEKFKFDYRLRDALFDGAQTGDYCAHFWFDPDAEPYGGAFGGSGGEIRMELVDGINVMFGNPNDRRVQDQPYIIISGRDTVEHLRWEAERFRAHRTAADRVTEQSDAAFQTDTEARFDTVEIEESEHGTGKAGFVYLYTKVRREEDVLDENGNAVYEDAAEEDGGEGGRRRVKRIVTSVHVTKATRTAVIYEDVDTGLTLYPVAWGSWEKQKNQYHGRALVTGLIPNQIFINSMFATAMRHLQLMAFPKTVYNADLIARWDNEIGQAIGVHGIQPGAAMSQVAYHMQPAEMSAQIFALIDKVMAYTKDCLGATDAQMGNVRPDNTSALMVLQTNAEIPLENIRANLYEWVEDVGAILLDMMGTCYGERRVVVERELEEPASDAAGMPMLDPETGLLRTRRIRRRVVEEFDFSQLKRLWLNLRVDVGATTYFSEIAMTQTLDNLRRDGTLDVIEYLKRVPDKLVPRKQELIDELTRRMARGENIPVPGSAGGYAQGDEADETRALMNMPRRLAEMYADLPDAAKRAARWQGRNK